VNHHDRRVSEPLPDDSMPDDSMRSLTNDVQSVWPVDRFQNVGVVLGLSGGADSVALLLILTRLLGRVREQASGFLVAAHFNHGLRGAESDQDESFCRDLASRLNIRFETDHAETLCRDEATMSADRMGFLVQVAKRHGARYLTLAHSMDDNVETVLHHLMRGTGPAGLCGIGSPRNLDGDLVLVRPMLSVRRQAIRSALRAAGQSWREDSSNDNTDYRRNWIRHELIPQIQSQYPNAVDAIDRAIQGQRSWRSTIDNLADQWIDDNQFKVAGPQFRRFTGAAEPVLIAAMQRHWTRSGWPRGAMTRDHWQRLAIVLESDCVSDTDSNAGESHLQRFQLPGGIDVVARGDCLTLVVGSAG
jgi:tRNA(Ile)-lysidine synthase